MPLQLPFPSFFTESGGPQPASQLDSNFAATNTSLTTEQPITAAGTTDLGSVQSNNVLINFSGSPTVSQFGSSAITSQPFFNIRWAGTGTATLQNSASILIAGGSNLTINPNDQGKAIYLGGGNWAYAPSARGTTSTFPGSQTTLASSTTTDLGTAGSFLVNITGTTTITAFGSSAVTTAPLYFLLFAGALTLTYNATSLILPTSANITTAAGDSAVAEYNGSGNWTILQYYRKSGSSLLGSGELILLGTATASTSASLNFTGLISSAYDYYFFLYKDILPATTTALILMRYSTNNGSSYVSTSGTYLGQNIPRVMGATTATPALINGTALPLNSTSGAGNAFCGRLDLLNPASVQSVPSANWKNANPQGSIIDEGYMQILSGASPINAVQFLASTGNITSGTIEMYGVKNT